MLHPLFAAPLSWLYGIAIDLRHKFFDLDILKSEEFDIPIVCVGNLTVGGTGKTPVTEFLVENLMSNFQVAVLSRGYKRTTKGFLLSTTQSPYRSIGDEPKQIKLKYPQVPVAVCEKRAEGIRLLRKAHPEVNLIILDDAFQHRYVEPWVNILLMDYNNPPYRDHLLPWGRLRDRMTQLPRANFVVMTKCPESISPLETRIVKNSMPLFPYQSLYFTHMKQDTPQPLFPQVCDLELRPNHPVVVMSGIANPAGFVASLGQFKIQHKLFLPDHHPYRVKDMNSLNELLAKSPADTLILVTEKDAVKLTNSKKIPLNIQRRLYYVPIQVCFLGHSEGDFLRQIEQYVRANQKYSVLHPE